jgi:membrane-associated protease RseP (regulator of RpoE activity)
MKHLLRSLLETGCAAVLGAGLAMTPAVAAAQSTRIVELMQGPTSPLSAHAVTQGYLGVDLADVDQDKAQALKLKDLRGAVITLIDHDAPAGQVGLKVNDVVLKLNGQAVEGAEQLRRMLREIPAGHKVSLEVSRDGNIQTLNVELADRAAMEKAIWNRIDTGNDVFMPVPGMGVLSGGDAPLPGGFHMPIFGSSLNVGAMVEALTSQMAEYLGVPSGLMIKQVARKSQAAVAGLKAFDVILKVGNENIATMADWDRSLRANQGKPVQVTILRDRKQQTVTLQVDSKRHGVLEMKELFGPGDGTMVAELDPEIAASAKAYADEIRDQMGSFKIDEKQAAELKQQAQKLAEELKSQNFKIDQKQLDQIKQQMAEWRKNFKPEDFKLDPKQTDELRKQMEQLKEQIQQWKVQEFNEYF